MPHQFLLVRFRVIFFPIFVLLIDFYNQRTMNLKALLQRFRAWQLEPYTYEITTKKPHQCFNCGNQFEGNYCPACGQRYSVGPMGWSPEEKDSAPLWGILEPGTLGSFILQILGRPGYMISDYLSGRKRVCSSPINMLCYVAIAVVLILRLTGNDGTALIQSMGENPGVMGVCLNWMVSNIDWAVLIQTGLLIIPTWLLFRFAPKHAHHSLVEGFYIQVFMAALVLICIMLRAAIANWLILLVPICNFIVYRQLFGYGFWGTLWRTILCVGFVFYLFAVLIVTVKYLNGELPTGHSTATVIAMAAALIAAGIGVLLLGWWISKKTATR